MKEYLENKNNDQGLFFDEYIAYYSPAMFLMFGEQYNVEPDLVFKEIVEKRLTRQRLLEE